MATDRASSAERAYFRRIGMATEALVDERAPVSLAEMFARLHEIQARLGPLAVPGLRGEDADELRSHLRLYERARKLARRGAERP